MKFTAVNELFSKGKKLKKIKQIGNNIDITKDIALCFDNESLTKEMKVLSVEIHADGIFINGLESMFGNKYVYQEWYCYQKEKGAD
jgi:hypothetical protein